ncbi:alpha/beta fold hydrolase, partial [Nonomuraea sp. NPDC055795]
HHDDHTANGAGHHTPPIRQGGATGEPARSSKPLLVIFGEEDRRWRSASAADYRVVPGAKVEMLPGLGHSPILEDPERTATALLAFTADQRK